MEPFLLYVFVGFVITGFGMMTGGPPRAKAWLMWYVSLPFKLLAWVVDGILSGLGQKKKRRK